MARSVKPSRDIFRFALTQHAADPEEAVHVGDSLREDIEGAEKAGLTGIWVNRNGAVAPKGIDYPFKEVSDLEGIDGLLANI